MQVNNAALKTDAKLKPIPPPRGVLERIGIDLISMPEVDGLRYVAIAIDYLSKYTYAKPLKDKSAASVADFIFEWVCQFGCPEVQINDQGKEFCNEVIAELHYRTGTDQRVTAAYHPQTNGLVENFNGTGKTGLLKVLNEHIEEWPSALPGVLFAHRTQQHRSTGYSPFFALFGQEPRLPLDLVENTQSLNDENPDDPDDPDDDSEDGPDDIDIKSLRAATNSFLQMKREVLSKARLNVKKAQEKQKYYYDKRHSSGEVFRVGDKVLLKNLRRNDRKGDWKQLPFTGPFILVREGDKGLFQLKNSKSGKEMKKWQSIRNFKMYHDRKGETLVPEEEVNMQVVQEKRVTEKTGSKKLDKQNNAIEKPTGTGVKTTNIKETDSAQDQEQNMQAGQKKRMLGDKTGGEKKDDKIYGQNDGEVKATNKTKKNSDDVENPEIKKELQKKMKTSKDGKCISRSRALHPRSQKKIMLEPHAK